MSYLIQDIMAEYTDRQTGVRQVRVYIVADSVSDLPSNTASLTYLLGSYAKTVDTGDEYYIDSNGTWVLQPSGEFRNVYTKSEVDSLLVPLSNQLDKDTNALVNLINSGGKNHAETNNGSATRNLRIPISIPAGNYVISIGDLASTDTDASVCRIAVANSADNAIFAGGSTRGADKVINFTISESAAWLYVYASDNYSHSSGDTVTISNLMVCSQADYAVSQAYEPYCPTLAELYALVRSYHP